MSFAERPNRLWPALRAARGRAPRLHRGVTVIELMVAILIGVALVVIAAVSMREIDRVNVRSALTDLGLKDVSLAARAAPKARSRIGPGAAPGLESRPTTPKACRVASRQSHTYCSSNCTPYF